MTRRISLLVISKRMANSKNEKIAKMTVKMKMDRQTRRATKLMSSIRSLTDHSHFYPTPFKTSSLLQTYILKHRLVILQTLNLLQVLLSLFWQSYFSFTLEREKDPALSTTSPRKKIEAPNSYRIANPKFSEKLTNFKRHEILV